MRLAHQQNNPRRAAILEALHNIHKAFSVLERYAVAFSLLSLLLLTIVQVIARNFFDTGFNEIELVQRHLVIYVAFLGAILATERNRHIKIDALCACLSFQIRALTIRPFLFLTSLVCAAMTYYAFNFWSDEWEFSADNERWVLIMLTIYPIGYTLLSLHFFLLSIVGLDRQTMEINP